MRYVAALCLTSALGCTSLWSPFAQDTEANCNVTPCQAGQTCNRETGFCEGGGPVTDPPDMMGPKSPSFEPAREIYTSAAPTYYMALADVTGGDALDIVLSSNSNMLVTITSSNNFLSTGVSSYKVDDAVIVTNLAAYPDSVRNRMDLLATVGSGRLYHVTKLAGQIVTTASMDTGLGLGYKLIDIGYVNGDGIADVVVTSTRLSLVEQTFGFNTANGNAAIFYGPISSGAQLAVSDSVTAMNLSLAASGKQPLSGGFTLALAKPGDTSVGLAQGGSASGTSPIVVTPLPAADFALPVDLDLDGDYDLVLGKTFDFSPSFKPGAINIVLNSGSNKDPNFKSSPLAIAASDLLEVRVDDYDKDGYYDLITSLYASKKIVVYRNDLGKGGAFSPVYELTGKFGGRTATFVDIDGDGCKDMVALFGGDPSAPGTQVMLARGHENRSSGTLVSCP